MKTKTKIWLFAATALFLLGAILFGGVMMALGWRFDKLSTTEYQTNIHNIDDAFTNIRIETDTASVCFLPAADGKARVECYEEEKITHTVSVSDGTLRVKANDTRAWYEHIGIHFGTPKVTVYLPQKTYDTLYVSVSTGSIDIPQDFAFAWVDARASTGSVALRASEAGEVTVKTTTGAITVENVSCSSLSLSVSTGSVAVRNVSATGTASVHVTTGSTTIKDLSCRSLYSEGSTGKLTLENTFAREKISIKRSTGGVVFNGCDATEIYVRTATGSVRGSLASPKDFDAHSDTGRVCVPDTTTGGRCEIKTDTGDIHITLD